MLNCTDDPLANYLKGFGYSVVLSPRGGVAPLQVAMLQPGRQSRIELTSAIPLAFGIKAVQIFPEGRRLSTRFVAPDEVRLESDFEAEAPQPVWLALDSVVAA